MAVRVRGVTPYGYRRGADGGIQRSAKEWDAVSAIITLWRQGESPEAIARWLHHHGYKPRGDAWQPTTIRRIIRRNVQ